MRRTYLFLTGGLGNQIFQVAAALALGESTKIEIDTKSGNPRHSSHSNAEFFSLGSHLEVISSSRKKASLATKFGGYVLRSNVEPVGLEKFKPFRLITIFVASMYFSILNRRPLTVRANLGVGYSPLRRRAHLNTYLIGYFQTYKWAEAPFVKESLKTLCVVDGTKPFEDLRERVCREKPLIVHIRRGDYAFEPDFGLLPSSYYRDGLRQLRSKGVDGKVWAFTDDREWANEILNSDDLENFDIELMDDSGLSTSEVFELMRFGRGYVIANSSFSWWAAYLSKIDGALVVAPEPWFVGLPEPVELIPPNWLRIRYFQTAD